MRINFQQVTLKRVEKKLCKCGRRFQRTISVMNTINPFNKNDDGFVKTRDQVYADVRSQLNAEVAKFLASDSQCSRCEVEQC